MSKKMFGDKKGFTLLEIVVSMAILGIVAIVLLPMFTLGFKGISSSGLRSKSTFLSQDQIEKKMIQGASSSDTIIEIVFPAASPISVTQNGETVTEESVVYFIPK